MTTLRQKMIEDMQLKGLAERTQTSYVSCAPVGGHFKKSPDRQ